jgi:hypothetical protein
MSSLQDPIALFRAAVDALNAEDWSAAAALCDPVSLRAFHWQLVEQYAPSRPPRALTVEEYLRHAPETPIAVAEHVVAEHQRRADPIARLRLELPGVPSADALRAMPPEVAFAHWLDGKSFRRQVERLAAEGRISQRAAALHATAGSGGYRYVPLGAVPDGARVAHVLFRNAFDPDEPWSGESAAWLAARPSDEQALARELWGRGHPQSATCRLQPDGSWRLLADHDFLRVSSVHIFDVREEEAGPDDAALDAT